MVIQIMPQEQTFEGSLGSNLGGLLGAGITALAASRINEMNTRERAKAYRDMNIPEDRANVLARLPQQQQQAFFQQAIETGALNAQPVPINAGAGQYAAQSAQPPQFQTQQNPLANLGALQPLNLGGQRQQTGTQGPQAAQQGLQNLQTSAALSALQGPKQQQALSEQGLRNIAKESARQQLPQQAPVIVNQQPTANAPQQMNKQQPIAQQPVQNAANNAQRRLNHQIGKMPVNSTFDELMAGPTLAERKQLAKEERVKEAGQQKESKEAYKKITKEYEVAKEQLSDLDRMKKLVKNGKLTNPILHSILNSVEEGLGGQLLHLPGINLHGFESYDAQEFAKLTARMLGGVKQVFPKATNLDVQMFLKGIPNLSQSDEAKLRNISSMEKLIRAIEIKKKAADQIIKEYGDYPPDLDLLVSERTESQIDKLYKEFVDKIGGEEYNPSVQ